MPNIRAAVCFDMLRGALVSIAVGLAMAWIYAVGHGGDSWTHTLWGAVVGLTIYGCIRVLRGAVRRAVGARAEHGWVDGVVFVIGGVIGWVAGMTLAAWITHETLPFAALVGRELRSLMIITASIALATGLLVRSFEHMKSRLARTVAAEKELELARAIQARLLPPPLIERDGFTIAARNVPAQFVAGDFYDVVDLDDGSTAIIVADVAGKGVGASLIMASVKAVLPFVSRGSVTEAMTALNEKLVRELGKREFVALAFARFDPKSGRVELANAGLPDPYRIGTSVEPLVVGGPRLPLGVKRDLQYETLIATLAPGERLLFVSDGIPEGVHEERGYEQVTAMLQSMNGTSGRGEQWLETFLGKVRAAAGDVLSDDWTAVVLEQR
jgi:serine phosphatase RsbU (regulator of sigma subunit)